MRLARRIELYLKACRAPEQQGTQRSIGIHEPTKPSGSLVGDAVGLAVEANARYAHERFPVDLTEIELAREAGGDDRTGLDGIGWNAEHAR